MRRPGRAHRRMLLALAMLPMAACGLFGPDEAPAPPFGTVTTFVGGRAWMSRPGTDSVIVLLNPAGGWFNLGGGRRESNGDLKSVTLRACASRFAEQDLPATVEIVHFLHGLVPPGIVGDWWEFWGAGGHWHLVSIGMAGDHLTVDALDLAALTIRGSFRFHAETFSGLSRRVVEGRFWGRVRLVEEQCFAPPTG